MKLLFDATGLEEPARGIAKATLYLYKECLEIMPSMKIIAAHRATLLTDLEPGIEPRCYGKYMSSRKWKQLMLPLLISMQKPTFVHFPWNGNIPPVLFTGAFIVTTIHDVLPLVLSHSFSTFKAEQRYRKKKQKDIYRSDLIITDSEYSKKEILNNFDLKKDPVVIPLGPTIQSQQCNKNYDSLKSEEYFLYVGGYARRKGLESLLKVFTDLHKAKRLSSKLILTGSPNYFSPEFKALVDEGRQMGIVEEKGYVSEQALHDLYCNSKALIYPSKHEGFGLPPLEAMSLGCPVITTNCTSIPEVCGDAAYYIDPDDEDDFAKGILRIETDPRLRNQLIEEGRKQASKFTWARSAAIFLNELQKLSGIS